MDDPIIEQAAAAAATPANDPPAPVATTPASDAAEMHAIATAQWHLAEQTNGTYTPTLAKPSDFTSRTQKAPVPSSISHLPPDQQAEYIARAQARTQAQMEAKKAADAAAKTRLLG